MSGPGDIGGEISGDEAAAWRELITHYDSPGDPTTGTSPWPACEDVPEADSVAGLSGLLDSPCETVTDSRAIPQAPRNPPDNSSRNGADRTRVIRQAGDPRSYSPADEDDDRYVPVPLPPPARLDPLAKAAWAGLIAGPGYLLLGVLLGWTIPAIAAFAAVAAFVAGFVVLVVRLGDGSGRDDNDDGAVV